MQPGLLGRISRSEHRPDIAERFDQLSDLGFGEPIDLGQTLQLGLSCRFVRLCHVHGRDEGLRINSCLDRGEVTSESGIRLRDPLPKRSPLNVGVIGVLNGHESRDGLGTASVVHGVTNHFRLHLSTTAHAAHETAQEIRTHPIRVRVRRTVHPTYP